MNAEKIRVQLRNGISIDKICKDYNITFQELFGLLKHMPDNNGEPVHKPKHLLYITKRDGHYFLRKGNTYYGSYYTLEDAKKVRDYFIFNRWDKRKLDKVCEELGVKRINKKGRY